VRGSDSYEHNNVHERIGKTSSLFEFPLLRLGHWLTRSYQAVIVPGGQNTYWKRDGSLAFTQAHSASTPDLLAYNSVAYQGGAYYGPGNEGLAACPIVAQGQNGTGNGTVAATLWEVYARFQGVQLDEECIDFYAVVHETSGVGYSAWQYV